MCLVILSCLRPYDVQAFASLYVIVHQMKSIIEIKNKFRCIPYFVSFSESSFTLENITTCSWNDCE